VSNVERSVADFCYDPMGNDEAIKCGDGDVAQVRVKDGMTIGTWTCPDGNEGEKACSDGVLPGVKR
jgi:hypothetical protein